MSDIFQMLYLSRASREMSDADLAEILAEARDYNENHQITGLLLYASKHFFQILEGEREQVQSLFARIKKDNRHEAIVLLFEGPAEARSFPHWWMGFENLTESDLENEPVFHNIRTSADLDKLPGQGDRLFAVMRNIFEVNR